MRRLAGAALTGFALAAGGAALWTLSQNPFATPLVQRSAEEARLAIERAMAREVTPEWLLPRLEDALQSDDRDRVEMLAGLARAHDVPLSPGFQTRIEAVLSPLHLSGRVAECAACALDIRSCGSLELVATCALPVELTPLGDANALRRQATNWMTGADVDRVETGLALVGLGATAVVVITGGSSAVVKFGATAGRLARRMGTLTPAFGRTLADAADLPVNWHAVVRGAPISEITDVTRLERLGRIAEDIGTVKANTSWTEALVLLRHVDSADDAAHLARLSAAAGPETRATLEVLGKARAFRALTRVSDLALAAIACVTAFAASVGQLLLSFSLRAGRRLLRPRPVARC